MGASRWTLRQIINKCGRIPPSMLEKAQFLEQLKDPEKNGILRFEEVLINRAPSWIPISS
jgi:hypothetical protein